MKYSDFYGISREDYLFAIIVCKYRLKKKNIYIIKSLLNCKFIRDRRATNYYKEKLRILKNGLGVTNMKVNLQTRRRYKGVVCHRVQQVASSGTTPASHCPENSELPYIKSFLNVLTIAVRLLFEPIQTDAR